MIRFKACRRCRGDIELAKDQYGDYLHCIQCGWIMELLPGKVPGRPEKVRVREVAPVA